MKYCNLMPEILASFRCHFFIKFIVDLLFSKKNVFFPLECTFKFMFCYCFQLQALEMQGKQVEAMVELSKICLLLRIFPPEESSVCIFNNNLHFFPLKFPTSLDEQLICKRFSCSRY